MASVSLTLEAGPTAAAGTGSVGAGSAGTGDTGGLGLDITTIGPEQLHEQADATPRLTLDYTQGSVDLAQTGTVSGELSTPATVRNITPALTVSATPTATAATHTDLGLAFTAAPESTLNTSTTAQRVVHREAIAGVFDLETELDGDFEHSDAIEGVVNDTF